MPESAVNKHTYISQKLAVAIRRGDFGGDGRLPPDRQIATDFSVSYLTARRAVNELVAMGLAERRGRTGTFVRAHVPHSESPMPKQVNLICSAYESTALTNYIQAAKQATAARGLTATIQRIAPSDDEQAVATIMGPNPSIVLMHEYFGWARVEAAMVAAADRTVLIGSRLDHLGVTSVIGHDSQAMQMACDYLAALGHRRTAFVMHHPELMQARLRIASWRVAQTASGDAKGLADRLIAVDVPRYGNQTEATYAAVCRFLADGGAGSTAFICVNDEMAMGVIAACGDAGLVVPQDMSIFCLSNSVVGKFAQPPVTCIDIRQEANIEMALDVLTQRYRGESAPWDTLHLIPPVIVERRSVVAPNDGTASR